LNFIGEFVLEKLGDIYGSLETVMGEWGGHQFEVGLEGMTDLLDGGVR
jgi:hypothetical protein